MGVAGVGIALVDVELITVLSGPFVIIFIDACVRGNVVVSVGACVPGKRGAIR